MKIKHIFSVIVLILALSSCKDNSWASSDITEVPIYYISDFIGTGVKPYALELYREKDLLLEYKNSALMNAPLNTTNYIDASTAVNYIVNFKAQEKAKSVLNTDTILNRRYEISADKVTKMGQIKVIKYNRTDSVVAIYNIKIAEQTRYN